MLNAIFNEAGDVLSGKKEFVQLESLSMAFIIYSLRKFFGSIKYISELGYFFLNGKPHVLHVG